MEDTDILMIYLIVFPSLLVTLCAPVLDLARQPQGGHPRQGGEGKAEKLAKPLLAAFEKDASELMRGIRLV